jgi:hypothetical protein
LLAVLATAVLATAAPAQREEMPAPRSPVQSRPLGAEDWARDLVTNLSDLQQDLATKVPGRQGQDLYQQARAVLDEAIRLRDLIQEGAAPKVLQTRMTQLNRDLRPLLDTLATLSRDIRSLKPWVGRIDNIQRRLEAALTPGARDVPAVVRLVHRLAQRAQDLQQRAWEIADQNPVFVQLAEDIEAFARTVANYHFTSQDPESTWEDLLQGFHRIKLAWLKMIARLEAWSPRQIPALYLKAEDLAVVYKRLERQFNQEGDPPMPSSISTSVRPSVAPVP